MPQNATSPTATHVACSAASPPDSRKIIANPSPVRTPAVGNSAGSASGATRWITKKAARYPIAKIDPYSAIVTGTWPRLPSPAITYAPTESTSARIVNASAAP